MLALSSKADYFGVNLLFCQMTLPVGKTMQKSKLDALLHIVPTVADDSSYCKRIRKA